MHCFFFGGISQLEGHIYFVDKANTQFGLKNPKIASAGKIDIFYLTPYPDVCGQQSVIKYFHGKIVLC